MKPTLFLSDLHLSPDRPAAVAAFHRFCSGPARRAQAVYILGDLFDAWIGDDQLADPLPAAVADSLAGVASSGTALYVGHGNRDFLLGARFAQATGASLLDEETLIRLEGVDTLLLHGDELCTGDADYQRYRARVRSPEYRRLLLRVPAFARRMLAAYLRRRSRSDTSRKPEAILDVAEDAVIATFRRTGVARMIHGHTHRPATHHLDVDGIPRVRIVLPDWHDRGHWLAIDADGAHSHEIAGA